MLSKAKSGRAEHMCAGLMLGAKIAGNGNAAKSEAVDDMTGLPDSVKLPSTVRSPMTGITSSK